MVEEHHAVAVGGGPANLSLAALYQGAGAGQLPVFERSPGPGWHLDTLFPGSRLQTSWVKDLVSLVDPRHELSFLNYVVTTGRVFAFLNAKFDGIPRLEYVRYLAWASERLDVRYRLSIDRVDFDDGFLFYSADELVARSRHVVFGLGTRPKLPPGLGCWPLPGVLLADQLAARLESMRPARAEPVLVVGSGQTGAECVLALLRNGFCDVQWLGRRHWFAPLDDSPPANDLYRPAYLTYFRGLPLETRRRLLAEQVLTSDGISGACLQEIYQTQYEEQLRTGRSPLMVLPGRELVAAVGRNGVVHSKYRLSTGGYEHREARYVVLATGRQPAPLSLGPELAGLVELAASGEPLVAGDYSLRWKEGDRHRIYVQNRAMLTHGFSDPNLSLLSVRAAMIVNSLLDRPAYTIRDEQSITFYESVGRPHPAGR